jgi:DNA polymerase III subunit epsilon
MLIRPDPTWRMDEWSQASAIIHGIELETLRRDGFDPAAVLLAMTRDLAGCIVVSDAPEADGAWLKRLCDVCGQAAPFDLVSVDDAIPVLARRRGFEPREIMCRFVAEMYSDDVPVEHRAGPDAARLLRGLLGA